MVFDYVSVLAGGECPIDCSFCVGRKVRIKTKPYFADMDYIERFMNHYRPFSDKLSISGSTSDPLFVDELDEVIALAKKNEFKTSLHTCYLDGLLQRDESFLRSFYRLSLSLHDIPKDDVKKFIEKNKDLVRVNIVYHEGNRRIVDDMSFFDETPSSSFTIRKNIFDPQEPKLKKVKRIGDVFNQPMFEYDGGKKIAVWDFADANLYIKAMYLWPDGQIRRQCFWHSLHPSHEDRISKE